MAACGGRRRDAAGAPPGPAERRLPGPLMADHVQPVPDRTKLWSHHWRGQDLADTTMAAAAP